MVNFKNDINLIGDLVNTLPVMADISKKNGGLEVEQTLDEGKWIYPLIPEKNNIKLIPEIYIYGSLKTDLSSAFRFGCDNDLHMTQCHHHLYGLPTPAEPVRPELNIPNIDVPIYDYLFAPFGRSAGHNEKWNDLNWLKLYSALEVLGFKVAILGNSNYDNWWSYGTKEFNRPMVEVLNILKKARKGCISIVTGISHLCYATGTKNYLLTNQTGKWGQNPDAIRLETYIPKITVDEVIELLNNQ